MSIRQLGVMAVFWLGFSTPTWAQQTVDSTVNSSRLEQQLVLLRSMLLEQDRMLNNLQRELQGLRGENEVLSHEINELKQQQQTIYLDLDQRLNAVTGGSSTASAATLPSTGASDFTSISAPTTATVPTVSVPATTSSRSASTAGVPALPAGMLAGSSAPTTAAVPNTAMGTLPAYPLPPMLASQTSTMGEAELYQQGSNLIQAEQFESAIAVFQDLLNRYPNGNLADNAQYWIGESFYALRQFDYALVAFNTLLERFPNSAKRSHALLKIGYVYYEQKDYYSARAVLEQVLSSNPNSSIARLAQTRLQKIQQAGY